MNNVVCFSPYDSVYLSVNTLIRHPVCPAMSGSEIDNIIELNYVTGCLFFRQCMPAFLKLLLSVTSICVCLLPRL